MGAFSAMLRTNGLALLLLCISTLAGFATAQVAGVFETPDVPYEVIARFECKLALMWLPSEGRFVFHDGQTGVKKFTQCTFESFMWHYAMVSIDEDGVGYLLVDGVEQELLEAFDTNDLTQGYTDPLGKSFNTTVWPNKQLGEWNAPPASGKRRHLLQTDAPTSAPTSAPTFSPHPVDPAQQDGKLDGALGDTGFPDSLEDTANFTDTAGFERIEPLGTYCTFRIGSACSDSSAKSFEGLVDEVAVWNRALPPSLIPTVMFNMPGYFPQQELEAPRGQQDDFTLGRVFYARFNNPCSEAPVQTPPQPPPPTPVCASEGCTRRHLLEQQVYARHERKLQQISGTDGERVEYMTDQAGYTAGTNDGGYMDTLDLDNDRYTFLDFPYSVKYAYTGAPWTPPHVSQISFANADTEPGGGIPMDGGVQFTISGVGFANSPWLKCAVAQPDPANQFEGLTPRPLQGYKSPSYEGSVYRDNWEGLPAKFGIAMDTARTMKYTSQVQFTQASVSFSEFTNSERISYQYNESGSWNMNQVTHLGEIHPFTINDADPYNLDFIYGYWEEVVCDAPAVAFPSDQYYVGVSNDGGLTGSGPFHAAFEEYAIKFTLEDPPGRGRFDPPDALCRAMGPSFTASLWFMPMTVDGLPVSEQQTVMVFPHVALSAQYTGVFLDGNRVVVYVNGKAEANQTVEISLDAWHHLVVVSEVLASGGRLKVYLDGAAILLDQGDGVDFLQFDPYPQHFQVGENYNGLVDEIKVLARAIAFTEVDALMKTREDIANPSGLLAYFRANKGFSDEFGGYTGNVVNHVALTKSTAPWEPSIVYSFNGHPINHDNPFMNMLKSTVAGGEEIHIEGFNLAPGPLMKCGWGPKPESVEGVYLQPPPYPESTCPVGASSLFRFDGRMPAMEPYKQLMPQPVLTTDGVPISGTSMICITPQADTAQFHYMSVGLTTMNSLPFEIEEQSLECDGTSGYVTADGVTTGFDTASTGYTISLWVYPKDMVHPEDAPECDADANATCPVSPQPRDVENRRRLLSDASGKRFKRRSLLAHESYTVTTVLAFETPAGGNDALVLYDGQRFMYYDDNILEAFTVFQAVSGVHEWHLVTLSWSNDGEGNLYVDNKPAQKFTTKSHPRPDSHFSMCQDYNRMGVPGSFFHGMIDNVRVYAQPITIDTAEHQKTVWPGNIRAFFDFRSAEGYSLVGGVAEVATSAPWDPPTVAFVETSQPETPTGHATTPEILSVFVTNVAISPFFEMYVGNETFLLSDLTPLFGTVPDQSAVGVTLLAPVVDTCQGITISASNDGGKTIGAEGSHEYAASMDDLAEGLVGYWSFDLMDVTATEKATFVDNAGGNTFEYFVEYATEDKDGFMNQALLFGSGYEGGHIKVANPIIADPDADWSLCWTVFFDVDYQRKVYEQMLLLGDPLDEYPLLSESLSVVTGGWKLFSVTKRGSDVRMFVNELEIMRDTNPVYFVLEEIFMKMVLDGEIICGTVPGLECMADTLYVYNRALKPCEVRARVRTQVLALDMSKAAGGLGAKATIPLDREFQAITVEAWVWPFSTDGSQSDMPIGSTFGSILRIKDVMEIGLGGDKLYFGAYLGNATCSQGTFFQHTSFRTRVPAGQWTHIAATFDGAKIMFFADGILMDTRMLDVADFLATYSARVPINLDVDIRGDMRGDVSPMQFQNVSGAPTYNLLGKEVTIGANFDGLIYDIRIAPFIIDPLQDLYHYTVCPRKEQLDEAVYFALQDGFDTSSADHLMANGAVAAISGLSPLWYNYSYDDPTNVASTSILGDDRFGATAGRAGKFTITSNARCGRKRVSGGDPWSVYMQRGNTKLFPTMTDGDDGNYNFYYWAGARKMSLDTRRELGEGFPCANYTTVVEYDGAVAFSWETAIRPGVSNATESFLPELPTTGAYGIVNAFVVQTQDSHGCEAWDAYDNDRINVSFTGPYNFTGAVTGLGNGQYLVSFVPESFGQYQVVVQMDGTTIKGGEFCYEVTRGTSAFLDGTSAIVVEEDEKRVSAIDLSFDEVTIEMWIMVTSRSDGYLLFKGTQQELVAGAYTKGYEVRLSETVLSMALYTGGGRVRSVTYTFGDNGGPNAPMLQGWYHLAGTYNGTSMQLYFDTQLVDDVSFPDHRRVDVNMYEHPLTIGFGFIGYIDELTMWRRSRSMEEINAALYCPPTVDDLATDVAAYFTFNEGIQGVLNNTAVALGHGFDCPPLDLTCLVATGVTFELEGFTVYEQSTDARQLGIGTPSILKSTWTVVTEAEIFAGSGASDKVTIHARDSCGYDYLGGDGGQVVATMAPFTLAYFEDDGPDGNELPMMKVADALDSEDVAMISAPMMCARSPTFMADFTSVTKAQYYLATFKVNGREYEELTLPSVDYNWVSVVSTLTKSFQMDDLPGNEAPFTAGVPKAMYVRLMDEYFNVCREPQDFTAKLSLKGRDYTMEYMLEADDIHADSDFNEDLYSNEPEIAKVGSAPTFVYSLIFTVGLEGTYDLELSGEGIETLTVEVVVETAPWHKLEVVKPAEEEVTRFEHTSVVYGEDLFMFGGASRDKTYLNDVWMLNNVADDDFAFMKNVTIQVDSSEPLLDATVEIPVNTNELIGAGRMRTDCMDMLFVMPLPDGTTAWADPLPHYMEPRPGCNSAESSVYVKVPVLMPGLNYITMVYGSPFMTHNPRSLPEEVYHMYEGFENIYRGTNFVASPPCGGGNLTEEAAPIVSSEQSFAGEFALHFRWGHAYSMAAALSAPVTQYRLRAWLWDSLSTESAHYISPNFGSCPSAGEDKARLPDGYGPEESRSAAVGTFTLSNKNQYCVASPWQRTGVERTGQWQQLEILSSLEDDLSVSINGERVKHETGAMRMDKVLLSSGFGVDNIPHPMLQDSHAFWDEISVLRLVPANASSAPMALDGDLSMNLDRMWTKVVPADSNPEHPNYNPGNVPTPRYSHTALVWRDAMVVFGGERSAHSFGDVWMFHFTTQVWEYARPNGPVTPSPRFDHTAVLHGDRMIISGGRSGKKILDDIWAFDLLTREWTLVLNSTAPMGPRFGHSAAIVDGTEHMFVFGGYRPEGGFTNELFRCEVGPEPKCVAMKEFCAGLPPEFVSSDNSFPATLTPRYSHTSWADSKFVYIYGGSNLAKKGGFGQLFRLCVDEAPLSGFPGCIWDEVDIKVPVEGQEPLARYEHAMAVGHGRLYVSGGHDNGMPDGSTYFFPVA